MEGINDPEGRILEKILGTPRRHAMFNNMPINNQDDRDAFDYVYCKILISHKIYLALV